jgi:DNA-binding transcriptional MerR regulator
MQTEEQVATLIRSGDGFLSSGEVARLHKISTRTVTRWADDGKIKCDMRGVYRRYPAAQFRDVLDALKLTNDEEYRL